MNREIKFRGKRIDTGEWVYGYYVKDPTRGHRIYWRPFFDATYNTYHFVIPETVGQFTGLKDKNDKDIWEGDILKRKDGISFVIWCLDGWRYNSWMPESMGLYNSVDRSRGENYEIAEIIGNIHDNPELIK